MTEDSGSGQAPSPAKYLLLLVTVVQARVLFTWLTSSEGVTARLRTGLMLRNKGMYRLVDALLLSLKP
ncbi:MAG: hypothetical protein HON54_03535 [Verrucomicrobia bacterium]|nr:hypothetical protein [Verrucomicrobiota bacterium]